MSAVVTSAASGSAAALPPATATAEGPAAAGANGAAGNATLPALAPPVVLVLAGVSVADACDRLPAANGFFSILNRRWRSRSTMAAVAASAGGSLDAGSGGSALSTLAASRKPASEMSESTSTCGDDVPVDLVGLAVTLLDRGRGGLRAYAAAVAGSTIAQTVTSIAAAIASSAAGGSSTPASRLAAISAAAPSSPTPIARPNHSADSGATDRVLPVSAAGKAHRKGRRCGAVSVSGALGAEFGSVRAYRQQSRRRQPTATRSGVWWPASVRANKLATWRERTEARGALMAARPLPYPGLALRMSLRAALPNETVPNRPLLAAGC